MSISPFSSLLSASRGIPPRDGADGGTRRRGGHPDCDERDRPGGDEEGEMPPLRRGAAKDHPLKPTTFRENGHKLTPKEVRERLERIPNEDLRVLGINPDVARPEWMVLTALLVPPVTVRPSITLESGDRSEDDLTHKLVDVLRINQRLRENRDAGAPQLIVEDLWEFL